MKYLVIIVLIIGNLFSQINLKIINIINFPNKITDEEFQPTNLNVSPTGFYCLDNVNRQIAFLSNEGNVVFAGGYGINSDAFIDPIEILSSKLRVWIIDRSENKLIEYDHKLNYIRSIEFNQIFPEYSGTDSWGNIYLQSEQEHKILISNPPPIQNFRDFIDLTLLSDINECITDFHVAPDGTIGILANCNKSVILFNRLGKLQNILLIDNSDSRFLIKVGNNWFIISIDGKIVSISYNEKANLPVGQPILDVAQMNGNLYLLLADKIWVVNVSLD